MVYYAHIMVSPRKNKTFILGFVGILVALVLVPSFSEAYVSVGGYYKSNGTYVAPYVRSSPNALRYDNYSWTPSQGLYNESYTNPTKNYSSSWYLPAWQTDPDYYVGKALYESGSAGISNPSINLPKITPSYTYTYGLTSPKLILPTPSAIYSSPLATPSPVEKTSEISVPENATRSMFSNSWYCNSGYVKVGDYCQAVAIPANASLNYLGNGWMCNSGYVKVGDYCQAVAIPANASLNYLGNGWMCNSGYVKVGDYCQQVIVPANANLSIWNSQGWSCNLGYKQVGNYCEYIPIPQNATHSLWTSQGWYCNYGYLQAGDVCQLVQ